MASDKLRSEVTSSKPRDEKGHFIKVTDYKSAKNPLDKFLLSHTGNYKNQDDLLDIRVGNPLRRVIQLLEEIKRQKAFSFTIKGSLGIAGVVLAISAFGFLGGSKIICDKGVQSKMGTVKILGYREIYTEQTPFFSYLLNLTSPPKKSIKKRVVLINEDKSTIYLPFKEGVQYEAFSDLEVIATGTYNSCSQTLLIEEPSGLEET